MSVLDDVKNIKTMQEEHLTDEFSRRMVVGKNGMLTVWRMKKGAHSNAHKHPEEQIFWVLSGIIELEIEGKRKRLHSGDSGVIPGNVTHEAWIIEDIEMASIFSPVRDDYLKKGALDYMKK